MQTIQATNYSVYFDETGYEKLASYLITANYSKIFILVDENTSQYCLPHLLNNLATEIEIEIIELVEGCVHFTDFIQALAIHPQRLSSHAW